MYKLIRIVSHMITPPRMTGFSHTLRRASKYYQLDSPSPGYKNWSVYNSWNQLKIISIFDVLLKNYRIKDLGQNPKTKKCLNVWNDMNSTRYFWTFTF